MRCCLLIALVGVVILSSTCASADELKVGAIIPLSGPAAFVGEIHRAGLTIGVDYINDHGGIGGVPITLVIEDSRSEPKSGVLAFNKLAEIDRVSVLFSSLTSVAMAIRPLAEQKKVVVVAESSHPQLTKGFHYVFRNFYTVDSANDVLTGFLKHRGLSKLGVLHTEDEFGVAAADDLASRDGGELFSIVGSESFKTTDSDLRVQLLKLKNRQPELIYVVGVGPVIGIAYAQAKQLGLNAMLVGYLACSQRTAFGANWSAAEESYSLEPLLDVNGELYGELQTRFRERFPDTRLDDLSAIAFDSMRAIAAALSDGARSGEEIRRFFASGKAIRGITGEIAFNSSGESRRPMVMKWVKNANCSEFKDKF